MSLIADDYQIDVLNDELQITKNGSANDVHINCLYTKPEIDNIVSNIKSNIDQTIEDNRPPEYFQLNESDQLYLYKPSLVTQTSQYYVMGWEIKPDYDLKPQTEFTFKDYLFGHTWALTWDGTSWIGNNCVNLSFNKQSTYNNNHGHPTIIVEHTDYIAKWINCFHSLPTNDSNTNFATILAQYVTNWSVAYNDSNGSIIQLPADTQIKLDAAPRYVLDNVTCDAQEFTVKVPSNISSKNMLYVLADLNINGNITPLRWDAHPNNPIVSSYLNTWNENPVIESFNYIRSIRHSNKNILNEIVNTLIDIVEPEPVEPDPDEPDIINPDPPDDPEPTNKNIYIYIDKDYFNQYPTNADNEYNPFEVIIEQQFYEVTPDPRDCTTLATDYNIYSSKIIWADNIMTMRRDLNIVGGNVDVLFYDYSVLKQLMDNFQEQMRLQAAYNEYTDSIRKGLSMAETVLNVLGSAVKIASTLSNLYLTS